MHLYVELFLESCWVLLQLALELYTIWSETPPWAVWWTQNNYTAASVPDIMMKTTQNYNVQNKNRQLSVHVAFVSSAQCICTLRFEQLAAILQMYF